ncbi:MAG: hypothetical protein AB3N63_06310 [Puniceicoccaceae bacterium]
MRIKLHLWPIGLSALAITSILAAQIPQLGVAPAQEQLLDFSDKIPRLTHEGVNCSQGAGLITEFTSPGGGVRIEAPEGGWDWSHFVAVAIDIQNIGDSAVTLIGHMDNSQSAIGFLYLPSGIQESMVIYLKRKNPTEGTPFKDMNGIPGGRLKHWDVPKTIKQLRISDLDGQAVGGTVQILSVDGIGQFDAIPIADEKSFFPFVNQYGQYKHEDWPGKIKNDADLRNMWETEKADLAAHSGIPDRSRYGGWKAGPKLKATGHFRTEKYKGKWWLVDPEGFLFWSHGTTGVGMGMESRITGRNHYFETIPPKYTENQQVDFYDANRARKYGPDWQEISDKLAHQRLASWGMNTVANWSRPEVYQMRKTPYVVAISLGDKEAQFRKDPKVLREIVRNRMRQERKTTAKDPWCIGYFVDNELRWQHVMDTADYYRIVSEEVKRAAPDKLYMGSRLHGQNKFHGGSKVAVDASRYCDIIGINRYRFSPADLKIPEGGLDKPIVIGEFHFGALDRGLLHTGLRGVGTQKQRAYAYHHYVTQALKHPDIVGTHWFQYRDQPITGRGDGENYQIGFVNIADDPYAEIVQAARWIGEHMYSYRLKN